MSSSGSQTLSESEEIKSILDVKVSGCDGHNSDSKSVTEAEGDRGNAEETQGDEDEKVNTHWRRLKPVKAQM